MQYISQSLRDIRGFWARQELKIQIIIIPLQCLPQNGVIGWLADKFCTLWSISRHGPLGHATFNKPSSIDSISHDDFRLQPPTACRVLFETDLNIINLKALPDMSMATEKGVAAQDHRRQPRRRKNAVILTGRA
ncbi:hypothetical protein BYT27DRAFT_6526706 [Phlegmacium glaucopus]|nr:hypothetical protein BYT27DRAFT_6526706 [Phlegmacium glaucopus]